MPFNPNDEYGRAHSFYGLYEVLYDDHPAIQMLHREAMEELPIGAVYEIRLRIPSDFGRGRSLGWYYAPGLEWRLPILARLEASPYDGWIFFGLYRVEGTEVNVGSTEDTVLGSGDSGGERTQE